MQIIDVLGAIAREPEGSFLQLAEFNGAQVGACGVTGESPVWELHPDTDELFYVLEGEVEITLLTDAGPEHHRAPAGSTFVVPKGVWHKPGAPAGAKFLFLTPGQSLHSDAADPRRDG